MDLADNMVVCDKRTGDRPEAAVCSGIGARESQQDSGYLYADDTDVYAVVCDGMGGLNGGERASAAAVCAAEQAWIRQQVQRQTGSAWMADAIVAADDAVFALRDERGAPLGAGSTFASVHIADRKLSWAAVGDSRVYLFHGAEFVQLTTDTNYFFVLEQQRRAGTISEARYQEELGQGEALTSFAGMGALGEIDRNLEPLPVEPGDVILLCSDGLYRTIEMDWMADILMICGDLEHACDTVCQIIAERGGAQQDNYTCILIRIQE